MKVQCDACEQATASVLCCADEAVLCSRCDVSIHKANKLASKHKRLSLLGSPSPKLSRCDICQEKAAFVFCLEDRALLCRDCDESVHRPDTLASQHQRFLATGIRLGVSSPDSHLSSDSSSNSSHEKQFTGCKDAPSRAKTSVPSFTEPTWTVDELLHLPDFTSKGATSNSEALDWDMNDLDAFAVPEKEESQLARVPQMPVATPGGIHACYGGKYYGTAGAKAKSKSDYQNAVRSDPDYDFDDTAFIVPDIETLSSDFFAAPAAKRARR